MRAAAGALVLILLGCSSQDGTAVAAQQPFSAQTSNTWVCRFAAKSSCNEGRCEPATASGFVRLNLSAETYSRCDDQGCDAHPAIISLSGAMTHVELPGRGAFIKVGVDGGFVDVATIGTAAIVSGGVCRPEGAAR